MIGLKTCMFLGALSSLVLSAADTAPSSVDLAVPESPAFTVLGVTPSKVTRPSTGKDLATSFLNGLDQEGNFQTGIAIDMIPYLVAVQSHITINQYSGSYATRFLSRASLSIGTTKGVTNDKSTRLATGLRLTLFDKGDPRSDAALAACFDAAFMAWGSKYTNPLIISDVQEKALQAARQRAATFKTPPSESDEAMDARMSNYQRNPGETEDAFRTRMLKNEEYQAAKLQVFTLQQQVDAEKKANDAADTKKTADYATCVATSRKDNANRSSWIVAAAPSWSSITGTNADMKWDGGGFWTSLAYGFEKIPVLEKTTQLVLHARYRQKELVQLPGTTSYVRQDTGLGGLQLRVGSPNFSLALESVYIHRQPHPMKVDNSFQTTLSANARITDGLWFNLALGTESGRKNDQNRIFILSQFQWGFSRNAPMQK